MNDYETFLSKVSNRESLKLVKGRDKLPTILERHTSKERVNFTRFNQINRINSEIEKMHHRVESLKLENESMDEETRWTRSRSNDELKKVEEQINTLQTTIEVNRERACQDEALLESAVQTVKRLCETLEVDLGPVVELLGDQATSDFNVLAGQLEKQLSALISIVQKQCGNSASATAPNGPQCLSGKRQASGKSKPAVHHQTRTETAYTDRTNTGRSFDFVNSAGQNGTGRAAAKNSAGVDRPDTSPLFDKLQGMRDSSDAEFDLPKYPLSRQELVQMVTIEARKMDGGTQAEHEPMHVPSNYSLELKSI